MSKADDNAPKLEPKDTLAMVLQSLDSSDSSMNPELSFIAGVLASHPGEDARQTALECLLGVILAFTSAGMGEPGNDDQEGGGGPSLCPTCEAEAEAEKEDDDRTPSVDN